MEYFFEIFAVLITCISACIAYQQWKTNNYKLKADLYDKRLAVYLGVQGFLHLMFLHTHPIKDKIEKQKVPKYTYVDLNKLHQSTSVAKFLFDKDIVKYLEEIYTSGLNILTYEKKTGEEDATRKKYEWLAEQLTPLQEKFEKYLDLSKL